MKRANLLFVLLLVGLVGCTYNSLPDDMATPVAVSERGFDLTFSTRAEAFDGVELDSKYFVAEEDLESFLNYKQQHSDKKIIVKDCTPYGFDNSHTLFYVINYDKGWEVVSADKRTQATLAYGEGERTFSMGADNTNEAEKFWMELLASDVLQKRQRNKSQATRSDDAVAEIANNEEQARVNYWNRICTDGTKAIEIDSPSALPWTPTNHIYTLGTTVDSLTITKGPYLQTEWGQSYPWNARCPLKSNINENRVPVGCLPVACGQLMYYFHFNCGWQLTIPTSVSCVGNIVDGYNFVIDDGDTSELWMSMSLTKDEQEENKNTDSVASLLTWLGYEVDVSYGDNGSGATLDSLRTFLNRKYNINCQKNIGYDEDIIKHQLDTLQQPMAIAATRENGGWHVWLSDGYKSSARSDCVYYLVTTKSLTTAELAHYSIEDATHFIRYELNDYYVHMNWGWSGYQDDGQEVENKNGYYSLFSNGWNPNNTPYNIGIRLFYNFYK